MNDIKISAYNSLGGKIVIIFSLLTVVIVTSLTLMSVNLSKEALYEKSFSSLEAIREIKASNISDQFLDSQSECEVISENADVLDFYAAIKHYHDNGGLAPDNSLLVDTDEYRSISGGEGRENLTKIMASFDYYDIFIICWKHGHVLWSAAEESDLGQNLSTGHLKDSGLGEVWEKVTKTGQGAFSDFRPYEPSDNLPAAFIGVPLTDENDNNIGVIAIQMTVHKINEIMEQRSGMGETGETYLVGSDNLMRSDSPSDPVNHSIVASFANPEIGSVNTYMVNEALNGNTGYMIGEDYLGHSVFSSYSPIKIYDQNWAIVAEISQEEVDAPITKLILRIIIAAVIALVVGIIIVILFSKTITKPILHAVNIANALGKNDLTLDVDPKYLTNKGETGLLVNSLQMMKNSLSGIIKEISSGVTNLSDSSNELTDVSETMNISVSETNSRTTTVAAAIEEMDVNMNNSSAGIEETSINLSSVASASTQMNSTITEISRNTEKAKNVTDSAVVLTNKVSSNINSLGDSAKEIGNVTETISNISSQTNLLALNATIEAARAGSAGKGFAVVAGEIKDLAHQTATATEDIKSRIMGIQDAVNLSISDIDSVTNVVNQVNDIVNSIAAAIEEQSITTRDISSNINEASAGVNETAKLVAESASVTTDIARNITKVSDSTVNVADQGVKIVNSVNDLKNLSKQLTKIVQLFKI